MSWVFISLLWAACSFSWFHLVYFKTSNSYVTYESRYHNLCNRARLDPPPLDLLVNVAVKTISVVDSSFFYQSTQSVLAVSTVSLIFLACQALFLKVPYKKTFDLLRATLAICLDNLWYVICYLWHISPSVTSALCVVNLHLSYLLRQATVCHLLFPMVSPNVTVTITSLS